MIPLIAHDHVPLYVPVAAKPIMQGFQWASSSMLSDATCSAGTLQGISCLADQQTTHSNYTLAEYLMQHFDSNGDGQISATELLNAENLPTFAPGSQLFLPLHAQPTHPTSLLGAVLNMAVLDMRLGLFVWHTFRWMLLLAAILSVVPGRLHGYSARLLRWPVLGLIYCLVIVELMVYIVIRVVIRLTEYLVAHPKHRKLRRQMAQATSYEEWYTIAQALDKSQHRDRWLTSIHDDAISQQYNWGLFQEMIRDMQLARQTNDSMLALAVIQQSTRHNVGGIMSEELYSFTHTGEPKTIVKEFLQEVVTTLHWVTNEALKRQPMDDNEQDDNYSIDSPRRQQHSGMTIDNPDDDSFEEDQLKRKVQGETDNIWKSMMMAALELIDGKDEEKKSLASASDSIMSMDESESITYDNDFSPPSFHREQILDFLKRSRMTYGRTALCLSGGASMAIHHVGVISALMEQNCLPHIISGTSAGSITAALACTRTNDELKLDITPEVLVHKISFFSRSWGERLSGLLREGYMFDTNEWLAVIKWFAAGDMTFLEAYRRTGRVLCIALSSTSNKSPPLLLNYISAPDVTIASACLASSSVPGCVPPTRLQEKDCFGNVRDQGETFWDGTIQQDVPTQGLAEMLNCQFIIAAQCNPHIVPFFFSNKGKVGRPSRWSSGTQETSWRGGYLMSAMEMYLKNDMKAKFRFLHDVEASIGFTSTLLTQEFVGTTTLVPQVKVRDFVKVIENPTLQELREFQQGGANATYEHMAMIKLHYSIATALEQCIAKLESRVQRV